MEEIKAIETSYKGYRFRSRLEAKWAVFFDDIGIDWEYEPEGFALPSGKNYLPDFKLYGFCGRSFDFSEEIEPGVLWCEVKGVKNKEDLYKRKSGDVEKVYEFSRFEELYGLPDFPAINGDDIAKAADEIMENINPIIILPDIPQNWEEWLDCEVTDFGCVDGDDGWPCFISKPYISGNRFVLCGYEDNYPKDFQRRITNMALKKARSTHFEFSEKDLQPLENEVEMLRKRKELMNEKDQLLKQIRGGF